MVSLDTEFAPDIVLVARDQLSGTKITRPPILAVEVAPTRLVAGLQPPSV